MKEYKENLDESLYSYLLLIKFLLNSSDDWNSFVDELDIIITKYSDDINIKLMGFPADWKKKMKLKTRLVGNKNVAKK